MANEFPLIQGFDELQKRLDEIPLKIERNVLRGALRAGMKLAQEKAKQGIHDITGDLAKSVRISSRIRYGVPTVTLKAGNKQAFYAHMVEFGTAAHKIISKDGKRISFGGGVYYSVDHPGSQKRPFMRPALDYAAIPEGPALAAVATYVTMRLDKLDQVDSNAS